MKEEEFYTECKERRKVEKLAAQEGRVCYERNRWDLYNHWVYNRLHFIKYRKHAVNVTRKDLPYTTHCPYLGIELSYVLDSGRLLPNLATIDRIDSSLGYVKGNVQIISLKANIQKNKKSSEQFQKDLTNPHFQTDKSGWTGTKRGGKYSRKTKIPHSKTKKDLEFYQKIQKQLGNI